MRSDTLPLRVLVVDDEPPIRRFLRTTLSAQGYDIAEAEDGAGALEAVRRRPPDLLVLDLGLPGIGGLGGIRRLRAD
ncbi:Fis family transcriptional regulator, partial [Azospirillum sp. Sp 7]|uniref:response regulator n=1 Tax=Azospirillum sp. Sp 7 TaxID=1685931 RepID=UPI000D6224B2